ncbi:MAG: hypothetical protein E6J28_10425 [Chloroflexi bacterium]|nr:MAG: hypothetical protein E6J28_10425 [Chloroflexota bacterium]
MLVERAVASDSAAKSDRDRSFLIFASVVLVAIALGFKSELLGPGQVWAIALGLVIVASPALLGYLRGAEEFPRIEHYIPVALGATTLAGLSLLVPELWKYLVLTAMFAAEKRGHLVLQETILVLVLAGAYLVIVTLPFNPILRLLWIFTITFLASYRSFRINGAAIAPRRGFIFALFVGQVVTFLAWAITALSLYLVVNEGTFAVMLLFAWYINRGLVRHTVEDSFTRNVVLEYGAFAVVLIYLFVSSYQPGR